jgi:hypothetical protein
MNAAPHVVLARSTLVRAARRLAATSTSGSDDRRMEADLRALERAVTAFVVAERATVLQVAHVVRAALRADDGAVWPAIVAAVVVHLAETAAHDALGGA